MSFRNLDMAFSQLKGYKEDPDYLDYSFMHLFYVIEDLVNPEKNDWVERNKNDSFLLTEMISIMGKSLCCNTIKVKIWDITREITHVARQ